MGKCEGKSFSNFLDDALSRKLCKWAEFFLQDFRDV